MRFTFQMFCSTDKSLKDEMRLLLLRDDLLVKLHTFVFLHITPVVKPAYIFKAMNRSLLKAV